MLGKPSVVRAEYFRPVSRPTPSRPWQLTAIEQVVSACLCVEPRALRSPNRGTATTAYARQIAMYLARTKLELSYAAIGQAFGRDRTTVAYACRAIEERREQAVADQLLTQLEDVLDPRLATCGLVVAKG